MIMRAIKALGSILKNFFILFSFVVNLILVLVIVVLLLTIFDLNRNIVRPLITGLHSSFVGLDEATIDWTIPVRDTIPVVLNIPLQTNTVVTLTERVPLTVSATIVLPGVGVLNNAQVNLALPAGLELPVALDLNVPVDETLDIALDVRAVIPINQTQLHDPIQNLRLTFEPIIRALYNAPENFGEAIALARAALEGQPVDLLADTPYSRDPWPGYSQTAGVGYALGDLPWPQNNLPQQTGIVPVGGIPALDALIRPDVYDRGGPGQVNQQAASALSARGVMAYFFDGSYGAFNGPMAGREADDSVVTAPQTPLTPVSTRSDDGGSVPQPDAPQPMIVIPVVTPISPDFIATLQPPASAGP
jgi:hypothetical protein